ncbi:MAG: hypothetical protein ABUL73_05885 [Alphaproteobacteria bacterium]
MVDDHFLKHGLDSHAFPRPAILVSALFSAVLFSVIVVAVVASVAAA